MFDNALDILAILNKSGYKAYIVGGFVRDYYLGIESNDIDIATCATPKQIKKIFPNAVIYDKYKATKISYNGIEYDLTTFRKDYYIFNHLFIKTTKSAKKDAFRRDFTINSLYMNKNKNIIDFIGVEEDFNNKVIKMIGNPDKRLKEDPLRILRAIRYSIVLNFKIDKELDESIRNNISLLKKVSYFRKKEELDKCFSSKNALKLLKLIDEYNLKEYLDIDYKNIIYTDDKIGMWAQIDFSNNYNFSKKELDEINDIKTIINSKKIDNMTVYKYGVKISSVASIILKKDVNKVNKIYNDLKIKSIKDINITFDDIKDIIDSINMNAIMKKVEEKIVNNEIKNTKNDIIKYIKKEML